MLVYLTAVVIIVIFQETHAVRGQDVTLTATPSENAALGSTINLTCSFGVKKTNFHTVYFTDNGKEIQNVTETSIKDSDVEAIGRSISESSEDSVVWLTIKASFCKEKNPKREYKCIVYDKAGKYGTGTAQATFAEPKRILEINGKTVCQNRSKTDSFMKTDVWKKSLIIIFSSTHKKSEVTELIFKIEDKSFEPFTLEDDDEVCSKEATVGGYYQFKQVKAYQVQYTIKTVNGESSGGCTINIIDEAATTEERFTTVVQPRAGNDTIPDVGMIGISSLLGIAVIVIIILVCRLRMRKTPRDGDHGNTAEDEHTYYEITAELGGGNLPVQLAREEPKDASVGRGIQLKAVNKKTPKNDEVVKAYENVEENDGYLAPRAFPPPNFGESAEYEDVENFGKKTENTYLLVIG